MSKKVLAALIALKMSRIEAISSGEDKKQIVTKLPIDLKNVNDCIKERLDENKNLTAENKLRPKELEHLSCKDVEAGYETEYSSGTYSDDEIEDSDFSERDSCSPEASPKPPPKFPDARPIDRKRSHDSAMIVSPIPCKQLRSLEPTAPPVAEGGKASYLPQVIKILLPACPVNVRVNELPSTNQEDKNVHNSDSVEVGRRMLQWIIDPIKPEDFFTDFWEKNALLVMRKSPNYYSKLISFQMIDNMLIENYIKFTTNIDVTRYTDGRFEKLNPEGRVNPQAIWNFFKYGCSICIRNPSTYLRVLRNVCSTLQEFFHCSVAAKVYMTPPNSQGYAPHFDSTETFVLQIEGRQRWRLYMPLQSADVLAHESSDNYSQEELGQPVVDEVLQAGDILYFPRGIIHQAVTDEDQHSLHITLSIYHQQAYGNLVEQLMPHVIRRAMQQNVTLRRGLPLNTWQNLGHGSSKNRTIRSRFIKDLQEIVPRYLIPTEADIDWVVDQVAKKFHREALPPTILPEELVRTIFGSESYRNEGSQAICDYEFSDQTSIRLLRANILRLVSGKDCCSSRIYYHVENALDKPWKYEANYMEIQPEEAAAVETLTKAYPDYIRVSLLPLKSTERRIQVAKDLWERGLLMTEKPFKETKTKT